MGCMVLCRNFQTAPEQGQGPTPIVLIVLVLVPVPVPVLDTASVITPLNPCVEFGRKCNYNVNQLSFCSSWTYSHHVMNIYNSTSEGDLRYFTQNGEWNLIAMPVIRHEVGIQT